MVFKVKDPLGRDSNNRLHQRPPASHRPPDTCTQRDVVRPISSSACLPDTKPEWRWQRKGGMRGRQRQIELLEEGNNTEHYNSSREAMHPFNVGSKHYKNLASVYSQVQIHKKVGLCVGQENTRKCIKVIKHVKNGHANQLYGGLLHNYKSILSKILTIFCEVFWVFKVCLNSRKIFKTRK